jgi:dihydroorotase
MMRTLIKNGTIVNEGRSFLGDLVVNGEQIEEIYEGKAPRGIYDQVIDASGCFVLPGVIDDHVHFREPGLTRKADIESESRAAAFGGVTSYFEMPNTNPQTTTLEALEDKFALGAQKSHVNYSFFFGATNDNVDSFDRLDVHRIPGIKLFMGSSTGNMLVDKYESLQQIFVKAKKLGLPVMTHCEDTDIINRNMAAYQKKYGEDPDVKFHPEIRSVEACYESSSLAVKLAKESGAHLHIAHVTTARELEFFGKDENITGEAVIAHLYFSDEDYADKKAFIKCNPAIKTVKDRQALREALADGRISVVGTDHAPHEWKDKQGGCAKAASGMPMVQFSLVSMLELVDEGVLSIERMVEVMSHHPAKLFQVDKRGFLRPGYQADIVIVRPHTAWTVQKEIIQSKCGWSPMEGHEYQWQVEQTICNGHLIYNKGEFDEVYRGEELTFRKS